ncbi:ATP-binding cassette domain-containing protein [Actinomadura coerulea]|uniref:ATP-binding cassette domain-containing protein n=1 Tax=Actinomadura coerulea TaxID=46159 RepID=UPI00341FA6E3
MSGIVVEACELRVRCGARTVGDFSFGVPEGEVHALLGHAGSGKTPLLEALAPAGPPRPAVPAPPGPGLRRPRPARRVPRPLGSRGREAG